MPDKLVDDKDFPVFDQKTGKNKLVSETINNWMERNKVDCIIKDKGIYHKTVLKDERIGSIDYCQVNNCVDFKISLLASSEVFGMLIRSKYQMERDLNIKITYSGTLI